MLEWFTTIPGVLVICGVVLLIIAIVLFIMGSKNGAKKAPVNNQMNNQNNFSQESITNTEVNVIDPTPTFEPTVEVNNNVVEDNGVINFTPTTEAAPVVTEPELDFTIPAEETIEPTINTVNIEPAVNPSVNIYGGYSPLTNTEPEVKAEEPVIYGGEEVKVVETEPTINYPSFATSDIPAYVEPTVEETTPTFEEAPVAEPVVETPSFEIPAVEETTPAFEETPVVEPVIPEVQAENIVLDNKEELN